MRINEQLRALAVPIDQLTPDPENARDHDDRNLDAIRTSLSEFGQQKAIVVNSNGVIIAGNGLFTAAKELGWTEIAVVVYDGAGAEDAFAIADNRTAELSRWNYETLAGKLVSLKDQGFEIERLGWKDYELRPLLEARWSAPKVSDEEFEAAAAQGSSSIKFTAEQKELVDRAIAMVREEQEQPDMPDGRAVELICADFLSASRGDE